MRKLFHLNQIIWHSVFWGVLGGLLLLISIISDRSPIVSVRSVVAIILFMIPPVYLHFFSLDTFFKRRRYVAYLLCLVLIVIGFGLIADAGLSRIMNVQPDLLQSTINTFGIIMIATASRFLKDGIIGQYELQELRTKQMESELKFLKLQISPHFLFNTLNNIYALSLDKSDQTPDAILKLSELMRFLLTNSGKEQILLKEEIRFLETYLALEKLRLNQKNELRYYCVGDPMNLSIAPMILMVFIENAFKHGVHQSLNDKVVDIRIIIHHSSLQLIVENTVSKSQQPSMASGIGLQNVKRRLELIYPKKHDLIISKSDDIFRVNLRLDLQ